GWRGCARGRVGSLAGPPTRERGAAAPLGGSQARSSAKARSRRLRAFCCSRRGDRGRRTTQELIHIYAHEPPESNHRRVGGFTLWLTGLSGAGKTTIAHMVGPE